MKKMDLYIIIFIFAISCSTFLLYKSHFVTDDYRTIVEGCDNFINMSVATGRIIQAIPFCIIKLLGNDYLSKTQYIIYQKFANIMSSLILFACMVLIYENVKKYIINKSLLLCFCISTIFINMFIIDILIFSTPTMVLSLFFAVLASINYYKASKPIQKIYSIIFLFIGSCCYQGAINVFMPLSLVLCFISKKDNNKKGIIRNFIEIFIIYFSSLAINYFMIKITLFFIETKYNRIKDNFFLINNITYIINNTIMYFYIGIIVVVLFKIIEKKLKLFNLILIVISCVISCTFLTIGGNSYLQYRMMTSIGGIIGFIGIYCFFVIENINKIKILKIIFFIFFLINIYIVISQQIIHLESSTLNDSIVGRISEVVLKYEKENKCYHTNICFYYDNASNYEFWGRKKMDASTYPVYYVDWSRVDVFNLKLNRKIHLVEKNRSISDYFEKQNWIIFDEEQIICDGKTIHICCF